MAHISLFGEDQLHETQQVNQPVRLTRSQKRELRAQQKKEKKERTNNITNVMTDHNVGQSRNLLSGSTEITLFNGLILILHTIYTFGCPHSRDSDMAAQISFKDPNEKCDNLSQKEIEQELYIIISQYIRDSKMTTKSVDLCLFHIDTNEKRVDWCSKGTIINIQMYLYHTSCPNINTHDKIIDQPSISNINMFDQTAQPAKIILLKYIEKVLGKEVYYDRFREQKKVAFAEGGESITLLGIEVMKELIPTSETRDRPSMIDMWKNVVCKLLQTYLLHVKFTGNMYTKKNMCKYFCENHPSGDFYYNGIHCLLFREMEDPSVEIPTNTINFLIGLYEELVQIYVYPSTTIYEEIVDTTLNPTVLHESLYYEFLKSPLEETAKFCELWNKYFGNTKEINKQFIEELKNPDELPQNVRNKVYYTKPHTTEWKKLLKFHKCGRDSGIPKIPEESSIEDQIRLLYHLIRGCIGEAIAIQEIENNCLKYIFGKYIVITIGLIVEKLNVKGSRGCAPDLLILKYGKLIPIEIKTLIGYPSNNVHFRRAMYLAPRQVQTCSDLIGNQFWNMTKDFCYNNILHLLFAILILIISPDWIISLIVLFEFFRVFGLYHNLIDYIKIYNLTGLVGILWTGDGTETPILQFYEIRE